MFPNIRAPQYTKQMLIAIEPGMLWSMGSKRVGYDWVTELNWTELNTIVIKGEIDHNTKIVVDFRMAVSNAQNIQTEN